MHFSGGWALGMYSRWLKFLFVIWKLRRACIGGWICFFLLILLLNVLEGWKVFFFFNCCFFLNLTSTTNRTCAHVSVDDVIITELMVLVSVNVENIFIFQETLVECIHPSWKQCCHVYCLQLHLLEMLQKKIVVSVLRQVNEFFPVYWS